MLNTKPPGERTGYAHPQCYASGLADCDQKISREHYISENLLKRIGESVLVSGLAWLDEAKLLSTNALASKVLCKRHNEALSPLDTHITGVYDALKNWRDGQNVGEHSFDGEDIERWAIKLMLGFVMSGSAGYGGLRVRTRSVPIQYVRVLFGESQIVAGAGLFVAPHPPPGDDGESKLAIFNLHAPPHDRDAGAIVGVGIRMLDFTFLTTVPRFPLRGTSAYRPTEVRLGDAGVLRFRWEQRRAARSVSLDRARPNASLR